MSALSKSITEWIGSERAAGLSTRENPQREDGECFQRRAPHFNSSFAMSSGQVVPGGSRMTGDSVILLLPTHDWGRSRLNHNAMLVDSTSHQADIRVVAESD
jgi:hypothetical protein